MMDRLWRSKTTLQQKKTPKVELLLPNTISCRIIQLEMQIDDGQINKQNIIQLLQEYTKAVQFYEEKGDERHKLYQKKIQNFLSKPTVDALLKGGAEGNKDILIKKERAQQQIRKATQVNTQAVKQIIENSQQGVQKQKLKMQMQLHFQMQNLEKRLQIKRLKTQRGAKVTSASFSASSNTKDQEGFLKSFQEVKNTKNKVYM